MKNYLTTDEERKLLKAIAGNLARQYKNRGVAFGDLIDVGMKGLRRASLKYNPKSSTMFLIYGAWEMQQAMKQAIAEKKLIHVDKMAIWG